MKSNKEEILERLKQLDNDMLLLDTSDDLYSCIIVGGSALVLTDKIYRSTHDIDSIASSKFAIDTKKVKFYTVSTEDLVVSKLCAGREKDSEDIEGKEVTEHLNWNLLDKLIDDVCYGMLTEYDEEILRAKYKDYKERFC